MKAKKQEIVETGTPQASTPTQGEAETLMAQAIDKKAPVEVLERLLTMRRDLRSEKAKEQFDRAMANFQKECPTIGKSTQGYNYKYATLDAIVEQVKDLLSGNGFSYTFDTQETPTSINLLCKVKHVGGHTENSTVRMDIDPSAKMNIMQKTGSAITYAKRYAFCNAFGILTGDEDNDGVASRPRHLETRYINNFPEAEKKKAEAIMITEDQAQDIREKILKIKEPKDKTRFELLSEVVEYITSQARNGKSISRYTELTYREAIKLNNWLDNKLDEMEEAEVKHNPEPDLTEDEDGPKEEPVDNDLIPTDL